MASRTVLENVLYPLQQSNRLWTNWRRPLISIVSNKFLINMNIMFADIELIDGAPIGGTVGVFSGEESNIDAALDYLRSKQVKVEVLANA